MTRWNNDTLEQRHAGTTTVTQKTTVVSHKHFGVYIGVPSTRNTLEYGTVARRVLWNNNTLERWNNDILIRWNNDTLEQRHVRTLEQRHTGTTTHWNNDIVERWNNNTL